MAAEKAEKTEKKTSQRISENDWQDMLKRRDNLNKDIEGALKRGSIRMASIAIDERANLSKQLIKAHNMRERDTLAEYRRQLEDLKDEESAEPTEEPEAEAKAEKEEVPA